MTTNNVGFAPQRRIIYASPKPDTTALHVLLHGPPFIDALSEDAASLQQPPPAELPSLEVRESSDRGYGLFAVGKIPAYSRILQDHALLSMAKGEDLPQLWPKYLALPPEDRKAFDELSAPSYQLAKEDRLASTLRQRGYSQVDAHAMVRLSSRFLGNSFRTGDDEDPWHYGLFPTVARINHSCTPNAHAHYRRSTHAEYVYSLREIQAGEEIEITYFNMTLPLAERQARTIAWSFACRCPACSGKLRSDYERRLATVREWNERDNHLQRRFPPGAPGRARRIRNAIDIAVSDDLPWLRASLPVLYMNYGGALMNNRRPKREVTDASDEILLWQGRILGLDNPQLIQARRVLAEIRRDENAASGSRTISWEELQALIAETRRR